jgi:hypothetical protein
MSSALRSISESATAEGVRRFLARHQSAMAVVADNRPLVRPRERRAGIERESVTHTHDPIPHPCRLPTRRTTSSAPSSWPSPASPRRPRGVRSSPRPRRRQHPLGSGNGWMRGRARRTGPQQRGHPPPPRLLPRTRSRPATPRRRARRRRRRARRRRRTPRETSSFISGPSGPQQWISGPPKAHLHRSRGSHQRALPTRLSAAAGCG